MAHPTRMPGKPDTHPRRTLNQPSLGPHPATLAIMGCCPSGKTGLGEVAALGDPSVPRIDSPTPVGANTLESSPALDMTSFGRNLNYFSILAAVTFFALISSKLLISIINCYSQLKISNALNQGLHLF